MITDVTKPRRSPAAPAFVHKKTTHQERQDDEFSGDLDFAPRKGDRVLIGPDVLNPKLLDGLKKVAASIHTEVPAQNWDRIASEVQSSGSMSKDDLEQIQTFVKDLRKQHRVLHSQFKKSGYRDNALRDQLQNVHVFMSAFNDARDAFRGRVKAAEFKQMGELHIDNPTAQAYYQWSNESQKNMKKVLELMAGMESGSSPIRFEGNKVTEVTREQIWQTKMEMLDKAASDSKSGQAPEINVQYYELTSDDMIGRLINCANAGCKVRVNVDPGRLQQMGYHGGYEASEIPKKLFAVGELLSQTKGKDLAVSFYPVAEELKNTDCLMHRKLFRVGDQVLLTGMNANQGSGENIDCGFLIEGPAAKRLIEIYQRDVKTSTGNSVDKIYGEDIGQDLRGGVKLTPRGLTTLLAATAGDAFTIPQAVMPTTAAALKLMAGAAKVDLSKIVKMRDFNNDGKVDDADWDAFLQRQDEHGNLIEMTAQGGDLIQDLMKNSVDATNSQDNVARLGDISLPNGAVAGQNTISIGDQPTEREAIMLRAISTAEKFCYLPDFVVTRAVAKALAARQQELKAQGKDLDVRVVIDAGIYPDGGSPNEYGLVALEDAGIPVRWALVHRTNEQHPRKIHAKEIITDKMAMAGSTNLSNKGMRDNWEMSGIVEFREDDADSVAMREKLKADFLKTWNEESIELNSKKIADKRLSTANSPDLAARKDEARHTIVMESLNAIEAYANESAQLFSRLALSPPVAAALAKMPKTMSPGYALLKSVEQTVGTDDLQKQLHAQPSYQSLLQLQNGQRR